MALPHGAVGWSGLCDFGISLSYSLKVLLEEEDIFQRSKQVSP